MSLSRQEKRAARLNTLRFLRSDPMAQAALGRLSAGVLFLELDARAVKMLAVLALHLIDEHAEELDELDAALAQNVTPGSELLS